MPIVRWLLPFVMIGLMGCVSSPKAPLFTEQDCSHVRTIDGDDRCVDAPLASEGSVLRFTKGNVRHNQFSCINAPDAVGGLVTICTY